MAKDTDAAIREYLAGIGSKGGKARAARHSKAELSKWAKRGGRPKGRPQKPGTPKEKREKKR
jgi:hypothetical protein